MARLSDTLIDTIFDGRYRIVRRLGAGGMANVYLAEDAELGRPVAIKILNDRYANDDLFVERFHREAKSAAGLSHPNIVSIYDRGEAEGTYYIAMEVVDGKSLKETIRASGRLRPAQAIAYTRQILSALRFAHRNGIIHRDIKPHNILIGAEERLKVTDFGIARAGASQMTETGSIMGTAQYLSPEQARGAQVTAAADLYSVGIVLYEMLTGEVPFTGDTPVEIAMKHLNEPPRPPSSKAPGIPADLDRVVVRALAKSPQDRYQSAEELDSDLARIEAGLPVAQETTEAATAVLAGAGAAPTQVLRRPEAPPTQPSGRPPPPPYDPYDRARKRRSIWPWLLVLLLVAGAAVAGWYVYQRVQERLEESQPVPVPNVEGIKQELAVQKIEDAGLTAAVQRSASDEVRAGIVISQSPEAGTRISKGEEVTILVSTGVEKVQVPKVSGLPVDQAIQALNAVDLRGQRQGGLLRPGRSRRRHLPGSEAGRDAREGLHRHDSRVPRRRDGDRPRRPAAVAGERRGGAPRGGPRAERRARRERPAGRARHLAEPRPRRDREQGQHGRDRRFPGAAADGLGAGCHRARRGLGDADAERRRLRGGGGAGADHRSCRGRPRHRPGSQRGLRGRPRSHGHHLRRPVPDRRRRLSRLRVAVLMGGRSSEHEISLASGRSVLAGLAEAGYEAIPIEIGRDGSWELPPVTRAVAAGPQGEAANGASVAVPVPSTATSPAPFGTVDVVFPALHGPFGEDGTVQGLLELAGVPYVGPGVAASAVSMDKDLFKAVMRANGIPVTQSVTVRQGRGRPESPFGYPVVVKPARLGSSVGISIVREPAQLEAAVELAFEHDEKVLVEEFVSGVEVECSVLGNEQPLASVVGEIVPLASDWYDYASKYDEGGMELVVPARITPDQATRAQELAVSAFVASDCEGMARVDLFVREDGEVLVNELNTIPGFTSTSVYAKLFEATGIGYPELLRRLVELAVARHERRRSLRY